MYLQEEDRALVDDFVERSGRTLLLKTREMLIELRRERTATCWARMLMWWWSTNTWLSAQQAELGDQHTRRGWAGSFLLRKMKYFSVFVVKYWTSSSGHFWVQCALLGLLGEQQCVVTPTGWIKWGLALWLAADGTHVKFWRRQSHWTNCYASWIILTTLYTTYRTDSGAPSPKEWFSSAVQGQKEEIFHTKCYRLLNYYVSGREASATYYYYFIIISTAVTKEPPKYGMIKYLSSHHHHHHINHVTND